MLALLPLLLPFLPGLLPWPFEILASTPGLAAFGCQLYFSLIEQLALVFSLGLGIL